MQWAAAGTVRRDLLPATCYSLELQKRAEDKTVAGRDSYNEWLLIAETDWESKAPRSNQRFGNLGRLL
jgi:hypothetical protein